MWIYRTSVSGINEGQIGNTLKQQATSDITEAPLRIHGSFVLDTSPQTSLHWHWAQRIPPRRACLWTKLPSVVI